MPSTPDVSTSAGRDVSNAVERLKCPEHFQTRLNEVGGFNRYGQPNFRLAWAQTEYVRQGGEWEAEGEWFRGYRDVYLGDGLPHWMLLQWVDAGKCIEMPHLPPQSDVAFYEENRCPKTGLQLLGEYPYKGSYRIALNLVAKWFDGGRLQIRAFPLSTEIVEMMVPVIKASMEVSVEAKLRAMKEEREKDEREYAKAVEDLYSSIRRKPTLAATGWLEDKQRSIEKHFNAALVMKMHRDRVFQSQHRFGK
jgi:hypothetical protein